MSVSRAPSCPPSPAGVSIASALKPGAFPPTVLASHSAVRFQGGQKTRRMGDRVMCRAEEHLRWTLKRGGGG